MYFFDQFYNFAIKNTFLYKKILFRMHLIYSDKIQRFKREAGGARAKKGPRLASLFTAADII